MTVSIKTVHDGARNASVQIIGSGLIDWTRVVRIESLSPQPIEVRVDAVYYAVSDKAEVQFAWHAEPEGQPFLPLSGRGKIDFSEVSGIHNTAKGKLGNIDLRVIGENPAPLWTIVLDLSKHIGVSNG